MFGLVAPCGSLVPSLSSGSFKILNSKTARPFETSVINYPTTRRNKPGDLFPEQWDGGNLKALCWLFYLPHLLCLLAVWLIFCGRGMWASFVVYRRRCPWIHHRVTLKKYWKWRYCSVLNVGTKNSNCAAVVTAGSWSGGPSAAQPGR